MKRSRSSYEAVTPHSSDHRDQYSTSNQLSPRGAEPNHSAFSEDSLGASENLGSLQHFLESYSDVSYNVQANTLNRADFASSNVDAHRTQSQAQQSRRPHSDNVARGSANRAEYAGSNRAAHQTRIAQQHNPSAAASSPYSYHRRSLSSASHPPVVTPMSNLPEFLAQPLDSCNTPYSLYRGLFLTSDDARDHRHMSTRFGRRPYIDTEDDPTIAEVERGRDHQVGRIYEAMIRGDRAQDNPGSIAMKRWVLGAHYKSDLVEAFAHKVFDCLLVQVKEGFRGWHHNDYVDDDRKGEREDREADCMGRLENIIDALEREKTICEDVVNSASQIRMFVNAPIAYAARKYQNRLGNSKRGRTKEAAESNARPVKMRRTAGRQMRARSTTVSDLPASRDTTPQFQTPASMATPYCAMPCSPEYQASPAETHLSPGQSLHKPALSRSRLGVEDRQVTATAPPMLTRPTLPPSYLSQPTMSPPSHHALSTYITNHASMPVAQMLPAQQPQVSSPPSIHYAAYHSAPPSPDDVKYLVSDAIINTPDTWPTLEAFDSFDPSFQTPIDPSLTPEDHLTEPYVWPKTSSASNVANVPAYTDFNINAAHVSLVDIEQIPLQAVDDIPHDPVNEFVSYWDNQDGVQDFSFD